MSGAAFGAGRRYAAILSFQLAFMTFRTVITLYRQRAISAVIFEAGLRASSLLQELGVRIAFGRRAGRHLSLSGRDKRNGIG